MPDWNFGEEMRLRNAVISEARSWLGTPFHDNAKLKGAGTDCLGLLYGVYVDALKIVPEFEVPHYSPQHFLHQTSELYLEGLLKHATEVQSPQIGDIALFKLLIDRPHFHAGIIICWPTEMIHSYVERGVMLCDPSREAHLKRASRTAKFFDPFARKKTE